MQVHTCTGSPNIAVGDSGARRPALRYMITKKGSKTQQQLFVFIMADVDAFCPQPITVSAILSYCGSSMDLGINYSLLFINLLGVGALQRRSRSISTMNGNSSSSACTHRPPSLGSTLLSLAFGECSHR